MEKREFASQKGKIEAVAEFDVENSNRRAASPVSV